MSDKPMNDEDSGDSNHVLLRLAQAARRMAARGQLPENWREQAELGQRIASDLAALAAAFDPETPDALPRLCTEAIVRPYEGLELSDIVGDDRQEHFIDIGHQLHALSEAFRETSSLLVHAMMADEPPGQLESKARYWLKELYEGTPKVLEMLKSMTQVQEDIDRRVQEHLLGSTPWEQQQVEDEMAEGAAAGMRLHSDEQERIIRGVWEEYQQSSLVRLQNALEETRNHMLKVHEFMRGDRVGSDLCCLIAHQLDGKQKKPER